MKQRDDWHLTEALDYEHGRADPFAAAVRATRMPMVITDPERSDNPIVFCNEAFQTLTGYGREEIIGRNCRFLQGPDTDRDEVAKVRQAIAAKTNIAVDLLNYRKDGTTFWNALYLSPVRNDAGNVVFFFASQLDVTDRVRAQSIIAEQKLEVEREIEARTADLKAALEAKTLLLHEVDHRVKNNLTMIGSLLRLQARSISDPTISSKLEAMLERVDALATVHRRLYQSDDVTRFDVGAFAQNLITDVVGASGRGNIAVDADVASIDISSSKAAALGLILNEVATNTIKHAFAEGRAGTITLRAELNDGRALVEISDDGPGIAANGSSPDGLGKVLIARLAKQVGATAAWSDAAPGARFSLAFPGKRLMINRPCAPLNVLIVEDEALLAMDIEAMIEDSGHKVVGEAASLFDVEDLAADLCPDLAFVDIQLAKGTSGLDVCAVIRERWSKALVVFVTANPLKIPDDYAGGHGVIPKPFSRSGLLSAMRYIEEGVCDPPPVSPQPASFIASPAFAASWA